MTWVLILYMVVGGGDVITNVPGFQSEQECLNAANKVIAAKFTLRPEQVKFVCVSQARGNR